ncbi:DMT family transporter [Paraburkholderia tropica]|uniref:DMT family transporter n=1 Tax=Paraburkholderia tropica TaxID=92647 RepID=UPI001590C176
MNPYFILALAIVVEVIATSALRASEGFTRLWPSVVVVIGYVLSFYVLSLSLRSIPVGVVYATWSGAGIVLITLCAMFLFKQIPDLAAILGICLIISGVIVLNVFSKMQVH